MSIINNWRLWLRQNKGITKPINNEPDIDKIYIYVKDLHEAKYQFLTKKREVQASHTLMTQKLLFNFQMIWMMFIKTLKNTTEIKNEKY